MEQYEFDDVFCVDCNGYRRQRLAGKKYTMEC